MVRYFLIIIIFVFTSVGSIQINSYSFTSGSQNIDINDDNKSASQQIFITITKNVPEQCFRRISKLKCFYRNIVLKNILEKIEIDRHRLEFYSEKIIVNFKETIHTSNILLN